MKINRISEDTESADNGRVKNHTKRRIALVGGLIVIILGTAIFVSYKPPGTVLPVSKAQSIRQAAPLTQDRDLTLPIETPLKPAVSSEPLPAESDLGSLSNRTPAVAEKTAAPASVKMQDVAMPPMKDEKIVQDPLARDALALVGMDEDAEMYWFAAIQNSTLPASERQDLIDDLNEEGLPDPKHPTMDDLPLILSRLEIIQEIAPTIPGELDWKESYNDLMNLAALATGGGKPVN